MEAGISNSPQKEKWYWMQWKLYVGCSSWPTQLYCHPLTKEISLSICRGCGADHTVCIKPALWFVANATPCWCSLAQSYLSATAISLSLAVRCWSLHVMTMVIYFAVQYTQSRAWKCLKIIFYFMITCSIRKVERLEKREEGILFMKCPLFLYSFNNYLLSISYCQAFYISYKSSKNFYGGLSSWPFYRWALLYSFIPVHVMESRLLSRTLWWCFFLSMFYVWFTADLQMMKFSNTLNIRSSASPGIMIMYGVGYPLESNKHLIIFTCAFCFQSQAPVFSIPGFLIQKYRTWNSDSNWHPFYTHSFIYSTI